MPSKAAAFSLGTAATMEVSAEMEAARARLRETFGVKASSQLGGKGTARRKAKKVHKTAVSDDKKLQQTLKRQGVSMIPGIEDVQILKDDGTVLTFTNPKVQAAPQSNLYVVAGLPTEGSVTSFADFAKLVGGGGGDGNDDAGRTESLRRAFQEAAANGTLEKIFGGGGDGLMGGGFGGANSNNNNSLGDRKKKTAAAAAAAHDDDSVAGLRGGGAGVAGLLLPTTSNNNNDDDDDDADVPDLIDNFEDVSKQ